MDNRTAACLNRLTQAFYATQAQAFGDTRGNTWPGQRRIAEMLAAAAARRPQPEEPFRVLDIGCGNARFQKLLLDEYPQVTWELYGIDSCEALVDASVPLRVQHLDVVEALLADTFAERIEAPCCDACVAFGVMHHVPTDEARRRLLDAMAFRTAPGGLAVVSLWRFMDDPSFARKAQEAHIRALDQSGIDPDALDEGDYLLGWQDSDAVRYCHSFTHAEIDALAQMLPTRVVSVDSFDSDGRTAWMNTYLVLHIAEIL